MRTYQSDNIESLVKALIKAQENIKHAGKSAENPYFKSKYADLPAVIDTAKPHLLANGITVTQMTDYDEIGAVLVTQMTHTSGQWMRGYYPVRPAKPNDPQALGSAITYARRYAYCAMTGVVAMDDDDDGNEASKRPDSPFKTAAARKTYTENVIKSFKDATKATELKTLIDLNKKRFQEMEVSSSEHDQLALSEIRKQYRLCADALSSHTADDVTDRTTPPDDVPAYIKEQDEHLRSIQ